MSKKKSPSLIVDYQEKYYSIDLGENIICYSETQLRMLEDYWRNQTLTQVEKIVKDELINCMCETPCSHILKKIKNLTSNSQEISGVSEADSKLSTTSPSMQTSVVTARNKPDTLCSECGESQNHSIHKLGFDRRQHVFKPKKLGCGKQFIKFGDKIICGNFMGYLCESCKEVTQ